jgi:putative ABC transport system permease protein
VETLLQDLRFAVRSLRRQPGFVAVALATLALGIGTATAMFTVVNGVLLRPLPFREPGRLATILIEGKGGGIFPLPDADFLALREANPAFESLAVYSAATFTLTGSATPEVIRAAWVSGDFFKTLGLRPHIGRVFTTTDDKPGAADVVVLSHAYWLRKFGGNVNVVGQTLRLNDVDCTILGVAPAGARFPRRDMDLWRNRRVGTPSRRGPFYLTAVARLAGTVTPTTARTSLSSVADGLKRQYGGPGDWGFQLRPLEDTIVGEARTPLYLLLSAVGLLLLIALVNVANLLLARSSSRQREVALRAALGAGRGRITRQLLTESVLLGVSGGALGVAVAFVLIRMLLPLGETIVPRLNEVEVDARVLAFSLVVSLLAGILFGTAPALSAARGDLIDPLRESQRASAGASRSRTQRILVVAEVSLALMLTVGAGLLVRSLIRLQHVDPGFMPHHLLTFGIDLPSSRYPNDAASRAFYQRLMERLDALPGVESTAVAVSLPPNQVTVTDNFTVEGKTYAPGESAPVGTLVVASPTYFKTMGIPVVRGRAFDDRDREGSPAVVIVSRTLADRFYPNGDAVGRRFRTGGPERPRNEWMQIVGIAGDVKYDGLAQAPEPAYYLPFQQNPWTEQYVVVRTASDPAGLAAAAREAVWSVDRDLPLLRVRTMDEMMSEAAADPRLRTVVLACFGVLGLLLATIGVYGVMAYAVTQRSHELGVRAALGARPGDLVRLVVKESGTLVGTGIVIGLAGALALTRFTETLLFQVTPRDPATFITTATVLSLAAILASWLPARRAGRTDPIRVLRQ